MGRQCESLDCFLLSGEVLRLHLTRDLNLPFDVSTMTAFGGPRGVTPKHRIWTSVPSLVQAGIRDVSWGPGRVVPHLGCRLMCWALWRCEVRNRFGDCLARGRYFSCAEKESNWLLRHRLSGVKRILRRTALVPGTCCCGIDR
jgi:hypothetical protein